MDFLFGSDPIVWLQQALAPLTATPFHALSLLGSTWGVILVLGLSLWFWGWRTLLVVVAAVGVEAALRSLLVALIDVPRPTAPAVIKYEQVAGSSFPSGHLATAAVLWGVLAAREKMSWWAAGAVALGVAVARLYLGVHYIGDLLGALVLAGLVIAATVAVTPRVSDWLADRAFAWYAGLSFLLLVLTAVAFALWLQQNHVRWNAAGMVAGAALALPITWRWVGYRPEVNGAAAVLGKLLVGLLGLGVALALDLGTGEQSLILGAAASFWAAVWVLLVAPSVFRLLGLGSAPRPRPGEPARRVAAAIAAVGALALLVTGWSAGIEPRLILDVQEETVPVAGLPPEWEGTRVALFSDIQIGAWLDNDGMVRRVIRRVHELQPDILLFGGDLVYEAAGEDDRALPRAARLIRPLGQLHIPRLAVLGNHDWGMPTDADSARPALAEAVAQALRQAGFRVLANDAVALDGPGAEPLYVVGLASAHADRSAPAAALRDVPESAARVVLMHNPESFQDLPPGSAPLAVAGHTHGGQIRVPLAPDWSMLTFVRSEPVHADGWIDDYGAPGNRLYVNRGIGFSIIPVRFNCPPELTIFTLVRAED